MGREGFQGSPGNIEDALLSWASYLSGPGQKARVEWEVEKAG